MATKSVTLKDSNGDTLYPVTDSNVVNINQQKTLAQALDGVVYAEDPTTQAQPTAWIAGSDIDATQMPGANLAHSWSTDSISSTSWTDVGDSWSVENTGLYFVDFSVGAYFGSDRGTVELRIVVNNSTYRTWAQNTVSNWAGNYAQDIYGATMIFLNSADVFKIQCRCENKAKTLTPQVYVRRIY